MDRFRLTGAPVRFQIRGDTGLVFAGHYQEVVTPLIVEAQSKRLESPRLDAPSQHSAGSQEYAVCD